MKVHVVLLILGGLPDEILVFKDHAQAMKAQSELRRRTWPDHPPEDDHDEKHDLYLDTLELK